MRSQDPLVMGVGRGLETVRPREAGVRASPELGLRRAEDTLCLLHLRAAVAGVVHLQAVIQFVQVFFHFSNLLPGHMFQPEAHLWDEIHEPWPVLDAGVDVGAFGAGPGTELASEGSVCAS